MATDQNISCGRHVVILLQNTSTNVTYFHNSIIIQNLNSLN